jgi:hypothetical protein
MAMTGTPALRHNSAQRRQQGSRNRRHMAGLIMAEAIIKHMKTTVTVFMKFFLP